MASDDRNVDEVRRNVKSGRDEGGGTNGIEKSYSEESIVCIDSTPIVHLIEKRKNRIDGVCDEEHFGFRTISDFTKEIEQRTDCSSLLAEDLPWHSLRRGRLASYPAFVEPLLESPLRHFL